MIVEVFHSRGLGIYIDGKSPATGGWSVGEDADDNLTCHEKLGSDRGVPIGPHRVLGLKYDVTQQDFSEGADPTKMTLVTEDGDIELTVTTVKTGDPEVSCEEITLVGGETRTIDECTTYVRAE